MNEPKDPKLQEMERQAHMIEDPAKKEERAARQLETMRHVLDGLPKNVKRKIRQHENRSKGIFDLMKKLQPAFLLFIFASALAACSKDNPVAPQVAPDYDCRPCSNGGYCPMECYRR